MMIQPSIILIIYVVLSSSYVTYQPTRHHGHHRHHRRVKQARTFIPAEESTFIPFSNVTQISVNVTTTPTPVTSSPPPTANASLTSNLYPLPPPPTSTRVPVTIATTPRPPLTSPTAKKSSSLTSRISSFMRSVKEGFEDLASSLDPNLERVMYVEVAEDGSERHDRLVEIRVKAVDREATRKSSQAPRVMSCRVFSDEKAVVDRLKNPTYRKEVITSDQMSAIWKKCQDQGMSASTTSGMKADPSLGGGTGSPLSDPDNDRQSNGVFNGIAIYPGTKWCGAGNVADSDDDLGPEKEADACCREHDKCPDSIPAGESKYNLTNKDQYTKSRCDCDKRFHQCLREAKSFVGDQIGRLYFNVIQIECFRLDYPIVNCTSEKGFLMDTVRKACQSYHLDESKDKKYQFFDPPFYVGQSGPLLNIPVVSSLLEKPVNDFKNITLNGGVGGNFIAG